MEFDWSVLEKVSIGGITLAVIYFGFQVVKLVLAQWQNSTSAQNRSTEALDKNTRAFEKLSEVFEKQVEREVAFQERTEQFLQKGALLAEDTNRTVHEIRRKLT